MKTADLREWVGNLHVITQRVKSRTWSRKNKGDLAIIEMSLESLGPQIGLLAQRKFKDGWDACLAQHTFTVSTLVLEFAHEALSEEVVFDSAGTIPHDYTRD